MNRMTAVRFVKGVSKNEVWIAEPAPVAGRSPVPFKTPRQARGGLKSGPLGRG